MAEELELAMRKIAAVASGWKPPSEDVGDSKPQNEVEEEDDDGQDVLRAAAGGHAATAGSLAGSGAAQGGSADAKGTEKKKVEKAESMEVQLKRVDLATASADLNGLAEALVVPSEDVCVNAALAIAHVCARDEALQEKDDPSLPPVMPVHTRSPSGV